MLCRHCETHPISRPRRLCWACYYKPGVKELYPPTSKFSRFGHGADPKMRVSLPAFPTPALPGTPEKIAVIEQRARLRQELFHPDDATLEYAPAFDEAG